MNTEEIEYGESLWTKALKKFKKDRWGITAFLIVCIYFIIALAVWFNVIGSSWDTFVTNGYSGMSAAHIFGTNINGQDILERALYGTKTAFQIGFVVALIAVIIGGILGALAGFFSGKLIDILITWLYGVIDSIPFYLFVAALAVALADNPYAMHIAMISTFWTATCRIIRGEVLKIKHLEYVEAARAVGVSYVRIIFKHIIPNTFHILLVQSTILFVDAIKSEVILSFLNLGVKEGVSWGLMLAEAAQEVPAGNFNNFIAASGFMFILVLAFNTFSDALQDALDPKKVS
jgi:ABC-type dipeptide/oligopeptide/nickel transport system permease subunit